MRRILLPCCLCVCSFAATQNPLTLTLAPATVSAGGTAQLQFFASSPQTFTKGGAVITLDPAVFGTILAADVYSATGDQSGYATITGQTVDIEFSSQTGGVGRLPGLPVFTVTVPVLASAKAGTVSTPTFKMSTTPSFATGPTPWVDEQGEQYVVTLAGGAITVGGSLSVGSVQPLGSLLPAGTVVTILGTGFTSATNVQIDDVAVSATKVVSAGKIDITLGGAANPEFHRVSLRDGSGSATFFPVLHGNAGAASQQPIFPLQLYAAATFNYSANSLIGPASLYLQNPGRSPVDVTTVSYGPLNPRAQEFTFTVPPGATYVQAPVLAGSYSTGYVLPSTPIRATMFPANGSYNVLSAFTVPPAQLTVSINGAGPTYPLTWNASIGGPKPASKVLEISSALPTAFTVSVSTASGGRWLSVSEQQGSACVDLSGYFGCPGGDLSDVTASADPTGLAPGTYTGNITLTPQGPNAVPTTVPVALNIYPSARIFDDANGFSLTTYPGSTQAPFTEATHITSTADPVAFTATAATQSGQAWLSVSPAQGQTPGTIVATLTPSAFMGVSDMGTITVTGAANTLTISVPAVQQSIPVTPAYPSSLQFTAFVDQAAPAPQQVGASGLPLAVSVGTSNSGNWLAAAVIPGASFFPTATVSVDPTGLTPGTYTGTVNLVAQGGDAPAQVPVTLVVVAGGPPPVAVNPAALSLTLAHGSTAVYPSVLSVTAGNLELPFSVSTTTSDGGGWLQANPALPKNIFLQPPAMTPDTVTVNPTAASLTPGTYTGTITVKAPAGSTNSTNVPFTFTVTPANPPPPQETVPLVTGVFNAASQVAGPLAPGEIVTIFGQNFGPSAGANGVGAENSGVRVFFDGVAATLLYVSATQINAVVPNAVTGDSTNVSIEFSGATIPAGSFAVASAAPGIFTLNSSGVGAAAVLNQDNSVNSTVNPAARGTAVQIYATGMGSAANNVAVSMGGADAAVTYAGNAPGEVAGLVQVNAVVPESVTPGPQVPVALTIGRARSPATATIAVR